MPRLLLFDIDGTLLDTRGAGGASLLDAVEEVLGVSRDTLPPLDLAGATDGGVVRTLFQQSGHALEPDLVRRYYTCYLERLQQRLHLETFTGHLMPGVEALLGVLKPQKEVALGLLTGNIRAGAALKLQRFDLHDYFLDGAFGDDHEDRNRLGPFALQRMQHVTGHTYQPEDIIVIGDTPKDIACAHAFGARCLAVGTGHFKADALAQHQPWQCLEDLADAAQVTKLLLS
ncbi:Phosphoglycolate phosphatase, HAD superfamily [Prosthecobacter debontii]|uniref:phosphoglycolate phosphatase n=1 Tax=Prosthecobacter debontii TaxID=48467 RepID=A0A1T4YZN2_9BACT|nr:HAD family hydrolase [Prosthecobacter debontii]SKB07196.1 Phosphoglycolate phosphatase, HAD superfamily [Prosthecobacter debontii]